MEEGRNRHVKYEYPMAIIPRTKNSVVLVSALDAECYQPSHEEINGGWPMNMDEMLCLERSNLVDDASFHLKEFSFKGGRIEKGRRVGTVTG